MIVASRSWRLLLNKRPICVVADQCRPNQLRTRAILARHSDARLVILTLYENSTDLLEALRVGTLGIATKDSSPASIFDCVRAAYRRESWATPRLIGKLTDTVKDEFTSREIAVLDCLATGLSNREIGTRLGISEDTAKSHVRGIMIKLDAANRTQAIATAMRLGLIQLD
jgi:DNA-binding NarL/FixJ family response regulator